MIIASLNVWNNHTENRVSIKVGARHHEIQFDLNLVCLIYLNMEIGKTLTKESTTSSMSSEERRTYLTLQGEWFGSLTPTLLASTTTMAEPSYNKASHQITDLSSYLLVSPSSTLEPTARRLSYSKATLSARVQSQSLTRTRK